MAAGVLQKPGANFGPCEGECQHRDCAETRRMSATECRLCGKPIGYEARFYDEGFQDKGPARVLVHADCLEEECERHAWPAQSRR